MQQPREIPIVYFQGDISVDISAVGGDKRDQNERAKAISAAHKGLEVFTSMLNKSPGGSGLVMIRVAGGYSYDPEMRCYEATFRPNATVVSQIFHRSYGYGQVVAMKIEDLRSCKYIRSGNLDLVGIESELKWACVSAKRDSSVEPTESIVATNEAYDRRPWNARLNGPNSFVGLYSLAPQQGETTTSNMAGLLVIYTSALYNQDANYTRLKDAETIPTYIQFAKDPHQRKLRYLQTRNALRMAHDCMVALGLGESISRVTYIDADAVMKFDEKAPVPPQSSDRTALLDSMRARQMLVVPDVHNELDVMLAHDDYATGEHDAWATYYDGVIPVSQAVGGLLALKDGDPKMGVYHLESSLLEFQSWDGGFCAKPWSMQPELEKRSKLYRPLVVILGEDKA